MHYLINQFIKIKIKILPDEYTYAHSKPLGRAEWATVAPSYSEAAAFPEGASRPAIEFASLVRRQVLTSLVRCRLFVAGFRWTVVGCCGWIKCCVVVGVCCCQHWCGNGCGCCCCHCPVDLLCRLLLSLLMLMTKPSSRPLHKSLSRAVVLHVVY